MGLHIVIVGTPIDGFKYYGPFKTGADAVDWVSKNIERDGLDWWIAPLAAQNEEED